jgi:hypothetical protein
MFHALVAILSFLKYAHHGRVSNPCGVVGHVRIAELRWTSGDAKRIPPNRLTSGQKSGKATNRDLLRRRYSTVKLAVRQAVLFPVESLAWTSSRYEPFGNLLMSMPRPTGITGLPALT